MHSASFGISLPALLSGALAESASQNYGYGTGESHSTGQAHTDGQAESEGQAHTVGQAESRGWSHAVSKGTTTTEGESVTDSTIHTDSESHTSGQSSGSSHTSSMGGGHAEGTNEGWNAGVSANGKDIPIVGGIMDALGLGNVKLNAGYNQGVSESNMSSWGESDTSSSMSRRSGHQRSVRLQRPRRGKKQLGFTFGK